MAIEDYKVNAVIQQHSHHSRGVVADRSLEDGSVFQLHSKDVLHALLVRRVVEHALEIAQDVPNMRPAQLCKCTHVRATHPTDSPSLRIASSNKRS